ncbi:MAG: cache domain-containing protein [Desulfuromonadales bacterium]|nr:cache domain-containing protein [Desulfuromonadales bacterium]MBN2793564.1 cache domain-containing protein [Desulfuromonadales bacterium]
MKTKVSFIRTIRIWGVVFLLLLGAVAIVLDAGGGYRLARTRADLMRKEYTEQQRERIKCEVERVVKLINFQTEKIIEQRKTDVLNRVYEAHAIADNIYRQHRASKTPAEIRWLIIDAIRPIRYDGGDGYFFITGLDGTEHLFAARPDFENSNMLDVQDSQGHYVVRDMIAIARGRGEGFYQYRWTKPYLSGNDYLKISYVKRFEPYDWLIGSGVYLDDVDQVMREIVARHVEAHRFGPNRQGYVFILDLLDINGGKDFAIMYANPNRPDIVGKHISDDLQDARGKMFRKEFLKGLREKGECFVDYWYKKFDQPEPSPKTSYFKLAGEGRFIVAAGVYLDDVEDKILAMQAQSAADIKRNVLLFVFALGGTIAVFLLLLNRLSSRMKKDFSLFADFFSRAAYSSEAIDQNLVRFAELDHMAASANRMLEDKRLAEKAMRDEREQLKVTLLSIVDGVITVDDSGRVELMNPVAEQLTGWRQDEVAGQAFRAVFHFQLLGDSSDPTQPSVADPLLQLQGVPERQGVLVAKSGSECRISASVAPIYEGDGSLHGQVVVFRDETERIKTEEELFKVKKLESVGLLAGGIAHDFNNILAGLFGNLELAKRKLDPGHAAFPYLKVAHHALDRATGLTNQLLTFAKGGDPVLEQIDIQQLIADVVQFNLSGSQVKAEFQIAEDLWSVEADKGQLGQVIANLTINAKHAMPMGGLLKVTAENCSRSEMDSVTQPPGNFIRLSIADEGIGMSEEIIDKIFDPYFTTKHTGSGLGLATVRSIVEKHRGSIEVTSRPGEGTVFTLDLPAVRHALNNGQDEAFPVTDSVVKEARVLVVDDEDMVLTVLSDMLQLMGCQVDQAVDGESGKDRYFAALDDRQPYDLVIMDLTIPGGMSGKEACDQIRLRDPDAKVIAASGYSNDPIMAHYQRYGFAGRIVKPFQFAGVESEVARVLSKG